MDDRAEQTQPMLYAPHQYIEAELQSTRMGESNGLAEGNNGIVSGETTSSGKQILMFNKTASLIFIVSSCIVDLCSHFLLKKYLQCNCSRYVTILWSSKNWRWSSLCLAKYRVRFPTSSNSVVQILGSRDSQPSLFRECKLMFFAVVNHKSSGTGRIWFRGWSIHSNTLKSVSTPISGCSCG